MKHSNAKDTDEERWNVVKNKRGAQNKAASKESITSALNYYKMLVEEQSVNSEKIITASKNTKINKKK